MWADHKRKALLRMRKEQQEQREQVREKHKPGGWNEIMGRVKTKEKTKAENCHASSVRKSKSH